MQTPDNTSTPPATAQTTDQTGQTPGQTGPAAAGKRWLDYGNFFIVALGLLMATFAFLVALFLLITTQPDTGLITDSNQVLAILTSFFGVLGTLVGAYFAVKTSSDQATGATDLAGTLAATGTMPPTVAPTVVGTEPPGALKGLVPLLRSVPLSLKT